MADTGNDRLQVLDREGRWLRSLDGEESGGLSEPKCFRVREDGTVGIADLGQDRVLIYDASGELLMRLGETGSGEGQFDRPYDLTWGPEGRLFVSDYGNHRVQVFDEDFRFQESWGQPGSGDGELQKPSGLLLLGAIGSWSQTRSMTASSTSASKESGWRPGAARAKPKSG